MRLTEYFRRRASICTDRLLFRRLEVDDALDMYEYASREQTSKYLLWSPHTSLFYTEKLLKRLQTEYSRGEFFDFAVVWRESGKMIGTVGFTSYDGERGLAEIGYVLSPDYHGRGIATEALSVMLDFAFRRLGINRAECRYLVGNDASLRVMKRCNMTHLGVRGSLYVKGEYHDFGVCSLTKEEYFASDRAIFYRINEGKGLFARLFHKN